MYVFMKTLLELNNKESNKETNFYDYKRGVLFELSNEHVEPRES